MNPHKLHARFIEVCPGECYPRKYDIIPHGEGAPSNRLAHSNSDVINILDEYDNGENHIFMSLSSIQGIESARLGDGFQWHKHTAPSCVVVDFDPPNKDAFPFAVVDAVKSYNYIESLNARAVLFFSGNGLHLHTFFKPIRIPVNSILAGLSCLANQIAKDANATRYVDMGKVQTNIRAPYTINPKSGNRVIPIDIDELPKPINTAAGWHIDELVGSGSTPEFKLPIPHPTLGQYALIEAYRIALLRATTPPRQATNNNKPWKDCNGFATAILGVREFKRNYAAQGLSRIFFDRELSYQDAEKEMMGWSLRCSPKWSEQEVKSALKRVYNREYEWTPCYFLTKANVCDPGVCDIAKRIAEHNSEPIKQQIVSGGEVS